MNAVVFLLAEHTRLQTVMTKLLRRGIANPDKVFTEFVNDLVIHAAVEEEVFYPKIQLLANLRERTRHAYQEHHLIDVQIDELSQVAAGGDAWYDKLHVLEETLSHHLDEEEREVFPEVRRHLHAEELDLLGDAMAELRVEQTTAFLEHPPVSAQQAALKRIVL